MIRPEEFRNKWMIRGSIDNKPISTPEVLFKYLNQIYIDRFFKSGELKLGTFNSFKITEDSARADYQEGTHEYDVWNKDRSHKKTLRRMTGGDNAIYCVSESDDVKLLGPKFKCDGYFKITNPLGFAYEVSNSLRGFLLGMQGPALYSENGRTNFYTEMYRVSDFDESTPMPDIFQTFDTISKVNFDLFFSKRTFPYKEEKEYRYVWFLDYEPSPVDLMINCPGAIRFCERVT